MTEEDENKDHIKGFACSCGTDGKKRMRKDVRWALWYLNKDRVKGKYWVKREDIPDHVIHRLSYDYRMSIDGIYTDQWSAMSAKSDKRVRPKITVWLEFDDFIHGCALLLRKLHERFPDGVPYPKE